MNDHLLDGGQPVRVAEGGDRIGRGPWARLLASAIVPDESSARAERGRALARSGAVRDVSIEPGAITASVTGSKGSEYAVSLHAHTIPPRAWSQALRAARGRPHLAPGVEGTAQSVHLAHAMDAEHGAPLVPPTRELRRGCTCPDARSEPVCKHVAAVAFVVANAIDDDPSLLLRWRGCDPVDPPASRGGDPWRAGDVPPPRPQRPLLPGAVVKRLGRSGIRVGGQDLSDALAPAYRAFAAIGTDNAV